MATGVELVHVRKGKGRIHLTPAVTTGAPVHTLCGKELDGSVEVTEEEADCQFCLRREDDPAAISSAFFRDDEGSRLLELSLQAAQRRKEGRPDLRVVKTRPAVPPRPAAQRRPKAEPEPEPEAEPEPTPRGELDTAGLRLFSEDVYLTPGGVIVRMDGERIVEIVTEAKAQLSRSRDGLRVRLGDLVVEERRGRLAAKLAR